RALGQQPVTLQHATKASVLRLPQALPVPGTGVPVAGQHEHGGPRGAHAADVDAARRRAQRTTTGPQIGRRMKNCAIRPPLATPVAPATLALMAVTRQSAPTTKKERSSKIQTPTRRPCAQGQRPTT